MSFRIETIIETVSMFHKYIIIIHWELTGVNYIHLFCH